VKKLLLVLLLARFGFAQAPTCQPIVTPQDANNCASLMLLWSVSQATQQVNTALSIQAKQVSDLNVIATVIGQNQVAAQTQIESLNTSAKQLLTDDASAQTTIASLKARIAAVEAVVPNLSKGPWISAPAPPVFGTGSVSISWTNYVQGQAVFLWNTTPTSPNGADYPKGTGPGYTTTITKPSGTTIYYWLRVNTPDGTFTSSMYNARIP
jgi:hypothetical protein